jgi:antitoxin protein of toxin-antitoxin system
MDFDNVKKLLGEHDEQVDSALDKIGEAAKEKLPGQDGLIDKAVEFGKNYDFGGEEKPAE